MSFTAKVWSHPSFLCILVGKCGDLLKCLNIHENIVCLSVKMISNCFSNVKVERPIHDSQCSFLNKMFYSWYCMLDRTLAVLLCVCNSSLLRKSLTPLTEMYPKPWHCRQCCTSFLTSNIHTDDDLDSTLHQTSFCVIFIPRSFLPVSLH